MNVRNNDGSIPKKLVEYLNRVHSALRLKNLEFHALQLRFEPKEPLHGLSVSDREKPDQRQANHVLRRYDEALCFHKGYSYDPNRAYFDCDSFGTGNLRFPEGTSLLGTSPVQDRWGRGYGLDITMEEGLTAELYQGRFPVVASSRMDALFTMFQNRQSLTLLGGMAPLCFFIGSLYPNSCSIERFADTSEAS